VALALVALGLSFWTDSPDQPPETPSTLESVEVPRDSAPALETLPPQVTESLPRPQSLSVRPIEDSLTTRAPLPRLQAHSRRRPSTRHSAARRRLTPPGGRADATVPKQVRVAPAIVPPAREPMGQDPESTRRGRTAPPVSEPTLVELRLGQLATRTVQAFRVGEEALLPLTEFLNLAQLRGTVSPEGRLEGVVQPGDLDLVVDVQRDSAMIGRRSIPVPPGLMIFHEGELYLAASRVGELLGIRLAVSWPDLEVVVFDPSSLPVALQHRRLSARAALARPNAGRPLWRTIAPGRRVWDGFVLDYSWLMSGNEGLGGSSYAVSAGTSAAGGSLEIGVSSEGRADSGQVRIDASWLGVWRQSSWLKQLRLGDGVITGLGTRSLRGVSLTNSPFVRPSLLGSLFYGGRLAPGWEVEAYRGGELLGFDSTNAFGEFGVQLPVMYGENPVDFVAYGPTGETRRFSRTSLVAEELLPAGRLEYGLSAGECRSPSCGAGANVDLRYGLSQRWAVRAGADRFWRDTLPDLFHPYAAVTGSLTNAMLVRVQAVNDAFVSGTLNYEPSLNLRLTADYSHFDLGTTAPLLSSADRRSLFNFSAFFRPMPRKDFFYVEGSAQRTVATSGTTEAARLGLSVQAGDVRLLPYVRTERQELVALPSSKRSFWGLNSFILPRSSWGPFLRQLWIRTGFESEELWRPTLGSIQVARQLTPNVRLDLGLSWARGTAGPTFSLNLASNLRAVRSYTTMTATQGSSTAVTQLVQGSLLYNNASGGIGLSRGPSLQRAGLAGRVFLDANGNGIFDPGEQGLGGVRVQVGSGSALSDSSGSYQVWDVVPFEPVLLGLDSLSFESPLWVAPTPVVRFVPGPNSYTVYDVPIVMGGVLEGLVKEPNGSRIGGISLVLTRTATGERRRITTFTDGVFYALGLVPGEYELTVDSEQLDLLGYNAEPQRLRIRPDGADSQPSIEVLLRTRR
jgi:hypothetical protein